MNKNKEQFCFQWHITNLCNLRCKHCYQNDFSRKEDLDTDALIKIIQVISRALSSCQISINITGGEPFFRKDLFEILAFIETLKNISEISIISNGLFLNSEVINKIEKFSKVKKIKISFEGDKASLNDFIRGEGSFDKAVKNFELLKKLSSKEKVIMFTVGSYNYKAARGEIFNFAEQIGADSIILERFIPLGRGAKLKGYYLKSWEWLEVIKGIVDFSGMDIHFEELLPFKAFYISLKDKENIKGAFCNLGEDTMALMPNGDIYPCRRLPIKVGNILDNNFYEILARLKEFRINIENNLKKECRNCWIVDCMGCRAVVYALSLDLYSEDPQCYLNCLQ